MKKSILILLLLALSSFAYATTIYLDFELTDFDNQLPHKTCFTLFNSTEWCSDSTPEDYTINSTIKSDSYKSSDGNAGATSSTNYYCTASDCSTTCQKQIKNGLVTGCT